MMKEVEKVDIIAPVRSKYMLEQMLESQVDEIYLGLKPPNHEKLSFDGRLQSVASFPAHFKNEKEFIEVIELAKTNGVKVNFMANAMFIPSELEKEYINFVQHVVDMGIDIITVSCIQTVQLLRESGISTSFTSGSAFAPTNCGHLRLLKEHGINRVTIPHCITLNEMKVMKEESIDLIVIGNFGSGGLPGSCNLWESPNDLEIGDGTRTVYRILKENEDIIQTNYLDGATDCSLCNLSMLNKIGISGIKLIGREAPNPVTMAVVVDLFRKWIIMDKEGYSVQDSIKCMEREDLMWTMKWVPRFCEKNRCTYGETQVTSSYV